MCIRDRSRTSHAISRMHISHNLPRGLQSPEIATSHISRNLPHAHLAQSPEGTVVPGDHNLAHLTQSPAYTSRTISRGDCSPRRSQSRTSHAISRMHISHNLPRGLQSPEIAISHISRNLPHAHLAQSPGRLQSSEIAILSLLTTFTFPPCRHLKAYPNGSHPSSTSWKRPCARTSSAWACRRRACPSCMTTQR